MRKPHARSLRILKSAEDAEDHATALHAVRECRRTPELIVMAWTSPTDAPTKVRLHVQMASLRVGTAQNTGCHVRV
jgi:hypothetical protein